MNHGHCFLLKWHETSINRWDHWRYTYFQAKPVWDDLPQTRSCPNIHGCMSGSETNPWGNGKLGWFGCTQQPNSRTGWWWGKCLDWADPIILFMTGIPKIHQKKVEPDKADKAEACKKHVAFPKWLLQCVEHLFGQITSANSKAISKAPGNQTCPGQRCSSWPCWGHPVVTSAQNPRAKSFWRVMWGLKSSSCFPGETLW